MIVRFARRKRAARGLDGPLVPLFCGACACLPRLCMTLCATSPSAPPPGRRLYCVAPLRLHTFVGPSLPLHWSPVRVQLLVPQPRNAPADVYVCRSAGGCSWGRAGGRGGAPRHPPFQCSWHALRVPGAVHPYQAHRAGCLWHRMVRGAALCLHASVAWRMRALWVPSPGHCLFLWTLLLSSPLDLLCVCFFFMSLVLLTAAVLM